jgi:hypothetical protein
MFNEKSSRRKIYLVFVKSINRWLACGTNKCAKILQINNFNCYIWSYLQREKNKLLSKNGLTKQIWRDLISERFSLKTSSLRWLSKAFSGSWIFAEQIQFSVFKIQFFPASRLISNRVLLDYRDRCCWEVWHTLAWEKKFKIKIIKVQYRIDKYFNFPTAVGTTKKLVNFDERNFVKNPK